MRISMRIFPGVRISGSTRSRGRAKSKVWLHPNCDVHHRSEAAAFKCAERISARIARPSETRSTKLVKAATNLSKVPFEDQSFGSFLVDASEHGWTTHNLLVHLPSGENGITKGRSLAQMVATTVGKPLRVIDATSVHEEGTVLGSIRAMQQLVPGEVVYLDRIEQFPDSTLLLLLSAFCGLLQFDECDAVLDDLTRSHGLAPHLRSHVGSAHERGERVPHVLLSGPPGMGKIALARIVADELNSELVATSGAALKHLAQIVFMLHSLYSLPRENVASPPVLFIDDIDQLPPVVAELLCDALAHNQLVMKFPGLERITAPIVPLVPFVCVGATTNPGALSQPLRNCFGFQETMSPYPAVELTKIVQQIWDRAGVKYESAASLFIADRAKGTAHYALHLARAMLLIKDGRVLSVERANQVSEVFKEYEGFSDIDWLLMGLQFGSVRPKFTNYSPFESVSMMAHTTVIASTGIRWSRSRDARDAFGSLRDSFKTLVLPEIRSTGETMLRWEMGSIPII